MPQVVKVDGGQPGRRHGGEPDAPPEVAVMQRPATWASEHLALTGGTGIYRNIGGHGTLVEFGNGKGRLTLHVLSLVARGRA